MKPITKTFDELMQGADLLIKFRPDVLDYLFLHESGGKMSKLFYSGLVSGGITVNPEFLENERTGDTAGFDSIAVFDDNTENKVLVKFNNRKITFWVKDPKLTKFHLIPEGFSDRESIITMFEVILRYYLSNPYVELPIVEERVSSGSTPSPKVVKPPYRRVILTSNHHKFRVKTGVHVKDNKTGCIYPSITEAARVHNVEFPHFYYNLCRGRIPGITRIERVKV